MDLMQNGSHAKWISSEIFPGFPSEFSPKLQDKIWNEKPGYKTRHSVRPCQHRQQNTWQCRSHMTKETAIVTDKAEVV